VFICLIIHNFSIDFLNTYIEKDEILLNFWWNIRLCEKVLHEGTRSLKKKEKKKK
jgi:hypothetical protein